MRWLIAAGLTFGLCGCSNSTGIERRGEVCVQKSDNEVFGVRLSTNENLIACPDGW